MFNTLFWIIGASILSFVISAGFAGCLKLERNLYLLAYIPVSGGFVVGYYLWSGTDPVMQFTTNWGWGLVGAFIAGGLAVRHVLVQPASARRNGAGLVIDLLWPGFDYGLIDAMLLSVVPVMAIYKGFADQAWTFGAAGQLGTGVLALLASLFVTLCYHIGYPEYRGKQVGMTLVGNGIMTMAFLLTGNPLAAVLPHCAMHVTAMCHGRDTTYQLPPHYRGQPSLI